MMVVYNFQQRFVGLIADGRKTQTVRLPRPPRHRHARPGDTLQIYTNLRTSGATKIIPEAMCISAEPITLVLNRGGIIDGIEIAGHAVADLDSFAGRDGFRDISDMSAFFNANYGPVREFQGVLIRWVPVIARQHGVG
jgi:hypothetical protein